MEYLIPGETLSAIADKIREYVDTGIEISPSFIQSEGVIIPNTVTVAYQEYIDCEDVNYDGEQLFDWNDGDTIVAYGHLFNNDNVKTLVLYDTKVEREDYDTGEITYDYTPDFDEPYFYVGKSVIDGVTYDKWRKIHQGMSQGYFSWDSTGQKYIYTNEIVVPVTINPEDFPRNIGGVHDEGWEKGFIEGYEEAYYAGYEDGKAESPQGLDEYIPLLIQGESEQTTSGSYSNAKVYNVSNWENATFNGKSYNWTDEITVTASQKSSGTTKKYFTITVTNKNPILYVKVYLLAYTAAGNALGTSLTQYFTVNVPPSSSASVNTGTVTGTISTASSYRTVEFLKWSTT